MPPRGRCRMPGNKRNDKFSATDVARSRRPTAMKSLLVALVLSTAPAWATPAGLTEKVWIHGSEDCRTNRDPPIEVFAFDAATYVLRQNKCVHFEAPFIYVLFGAHTVFVQDTGATARADRFPLYKAILELVAERQRTTATPLGILVTHSHSHGDHKAADAQFRGQPGVTLVEPDAQAVRDYFGFRQWPDGEAAVDLGGRSLVVVPIPGHQEESLAVYDKATKWLLTGDTMYPGRLIVKDWAAYKASIGRLVQFSKDHEISAIMGTHIEMSRGGELFPPGSTFQPDEARLPLAVDDLLRLHERLTQAGNKPTAIRMERFVVAPMGGLQRALGEIFRSR
jgi:hydroxyacylglutathione hydrolase